MSWGRVSIVTKPTLKPVTVAEIKTRARVEHSDEDTDIGIMIDEAVSKIERDNGIALMTQTWRMSMDMFPTHIALHGWPVQSVTSVKYRDTDGVEQTLSSSVYRLDTNSVPARISLMPDQSWPTPESSYGAVWVDYVLGEGDPADVNLDLKGAVMLFATHRYDCRHLVDEKQLSEVPYAVEHLCREHRQAWVSG